MIFRSKKKRRSHHGASLNLTAEPVFQQSNLLLCFAASTSRARRPVLPVKPLKVAVRGLPFIDVRQARQRDGTYPRQSICRATATDYYIIIITVVIIGLTSL